MTAPDYHRDRDISFVMDDDRRKHKRYQVSGLKSDISDGSSAYLVVVEDLSRNGLGLSRVPSNFDETVKKCLAVVNAPLNDFNLSLIPRWVQVAEKGDHKKIGFEIENPTPEWLEFVGSLHAESGNNRKEKTKRIKAQGLMTVISDGRSSYFGIVEEISEKGVRLSNIPNDFDDKTRKCTAVIHSPAGDLNISLVPCWVKPTNRGMYKSVGFQIQNPPSDWQGFIENMGKEAGDCSFFLLKEENGEE